MGSTLGELRGTGRTPATTDSIHAVRERSLG